MWTFADRLLEALVPGLRASADTCQYAGSGCAEPCQLGSFWGYMWTDTYVCTDAWGNQYLRNIPQGCGTIC